MKADQSYALQQKEVRCFLLKKQEKYGQPLKCPAPAMKKGRQLLPLRNHPRNSAVEKPRLRPAENRRRLPYFQKDSQ